MVLTCGVDVGGTKILAVGLDAAAGARVGDEVRVPTPAGAAAVVDAVVGVVRVVEQSARQPVVGVGLGIPGLVDRGGVLRVGANLPGVVDEPFGSVLTDRLRVPVTVDNDATCAAWAEHELGASRGFDDALLVTLGTGIGGGIVAGGQLQRGAHGFAGEPGHMVVDPTGPRCPCGRRGCWERFGSGSGLARLARDFAHANRVRRVVELAGGEPEDVRGEHVTAAAAEGDEPALEVMREFGWWVALGIANLVALFDPQVVIVSGGLIDAGELLLSPVRAAFADLVVDRAHRVGVEIVPASLGSDAGAIGAALLARRGD